MKTLSKEKEDYLKIISQCQGENKFVKNEKLAKQLCLANPTVTEMCQKLSKERLVTYTPYKGVKLTKKGIEYVKTLEERQRILRSFLDKTLHCDEKEMNYLLNHLEHIDCQLFFDKLAEFEKQSKIRLA